MVNEICVSWGYNMSLFCDRFRQLKEESGLTLKELSKQIDISVPNLSYYMTGREPSYDILIKIAAHFNVTTDWLIGHNINIDGRTDYIHMSNLYDEVRLLRKENKELKKKLNCIKEIVTK